MKKLLILCVIFLVSNSLLFSQVAINADGSPPDPSAGLDVNFPNKGLLLPRVTFLERSDIVNPAEGLIIYCTDCGPESTGALSIYQGGAWRNFNLDCAAPNKPVAGPHDTYLNQIVWNWEEVPIANGYKWNTVNDYNTATELGTVTSVTENDLTCWTIYTRYLWAFNGCGPSPVTILTDSTTMVPFSPASAGGGGSNPTDTSIVWGWAPVAGATGYRIGEFNDFYSADEAPYFLFYESGLTCQTEYSRYIWAYDECGYSTPTIIYGTTLSDPPATPLAGTHVPSVDQIIWNWEPAAGADGYKWNTENDYGTADDMESVTSMTEIGLSCNTLHNSYVWAYSDCGVSTPVELLQSTSLDPPDAPLAATHVPAAGQIVWNWSPVGDATGYKWNDTDDYETADDMLTATTFEQTGLTCNTDYISYVWAYSLCGVSDSTVLTQTTSLDPPDSPVAATHVDSPGEIIWNWSPVGDATGYKWNDTDDYETADDMLTATTFEQTGLTCNTDYISYVWAYSLCGVSDSTVLSHSTSLDPPDAPFEATHVTSPTEIEWKWNLVSGADGYKWNTVNQYDGATDVFNDTLKIESGLTCDIPYTRYVWAYSACGVSTSTELIQSTTLDPPDAPLTGTHVSDITGIVWNWNTVIDATGYKWNDTNDYLTADEMGTATTWGQTGLACNTDYTSYVWAYGPCGVSDSTELSQSTLTDPPAAPAVAAHVPSADQIVWNWSPVGDATGYMWNDTDDLETAEDKGLATTWTQTGLTCNIEYTSYVWAYNLCGVSGSTLLTQTTSLDPPDSPITGTHTATSVRITWNWNTVPDATGYKWNDEDVYSTAVDTDGALSIVEDGLTCNMLYTRYVWAYSNCGESASTELTMSTENDQPDAPTPAAHTPSAEQIVWNWNTVNGATGYKWSVGNDYAGALDLELNTTVTQPGLTCNTEYTIYVWAYNICDHSVATQLLDTTLLDPPDAPITGTHVPALEAITWNWSPVTSATGYKWSTVDDFDNATDVGAVTTWPQAGLTCNTPYTSFVWAYSNCGNSTTTTLEQSTSANPPAAPVAGTHTATTSQITWNWNTVTGADGYKWNTTNTYTGAVDMGTNTSTTEGELTCNTLFERFVWAYGPCGVSDATTLTKSTTNDPPTAPAELTHNASSTQIVWNWGSVEGAAGYKWSLTDNFTTADDMGLNTSKTHTSLVCNTPYTSYVWAYNNCDNSSAVMMTQSTTNDAPITPTAATHIASYSEINWNWNPAAGADGYKWNTVDNYSSATNLFTATTFTQSGLVCGNSYTLYVWAYNGCGVSLVATFTQSTLNCWSCSDSLVVFHVAGDIAPVSKNTTYGTVTNVPGETSKCWITSNLGSDHQASSAYDNSEASAGWYWQFNKKQGFKHDGTNRTPNSTWIYSIIEYSIWTPENDPCALELGTGWRIPTKVEWDHVDASGGWGGPAGPWNSLLKMHLAGYLAQSSGDLTNRGTSSGYYWSGTQSADEIGWSLKISPGSCGSSTISKTIGSSIRCIKD